MILGGGGTIWTPAGDARDFVTFFIELSRADILGVEEIEIYIRRATNFPEAQPLEPAFG